uniref:Uncharacterized protein n=1 Tax=Staphylococcus epidermidis TaxID=1282 RepID=D2JD12_STAEP|nr:hypothetical protein SAP025A_006 [Staphylococcus epidermidis]
MIFNKKIELEYKFEDEVTICRDIYKVSVSNSENGRIIFIINHKNIGLLILKRESLIF